jgi:hypothetical protein
VKNTSLVTYSGAQLHVFGQARAQAVEPFGHLLAEKAGQRMRPQVYLDAGIMPACCRIFTKETPAVVLCRMVSSNKMAPLMPASPRPGVVTSSSR